MLLTNSYVKLIRAVYSGKYNINNVKRETTTKKGLRECRNVISDAPFSLVLQLILFDILHDESGTACRL